MYNKVKYFLQSSPLLVKEFQYTKLVNRLSVFFAQSRGVNYRDNSNGIDGHTKKQLLNGDYAKNNFPHMTLTRKKMTIMRNKGLLMKRKGILQNVYQEILKKTRITTASSLSMSESAANEPLQEIDQIDVECCITFPTENLEKTQPVIFLLGWLESKDKHLAKYSSIYEREGCITIRCTHPSKGVTFTDLSYSKDREDISVKLVQLLNDYDLADHPILVHAFSNGGCFFYYYLANEIQKNEVNLAGGIFDSGPGKLDYLANKEGKVCTGKTSMLFYVTARLKYLMRLNRKPPLYNVMKHSKLHSWPHLFLYSSADVTLPVRHIEEMAKGRENAGSLFVQKHDFVTSPHVFHFKEFPDVYTEKCTTFLYQCLEAYHHKSIPLHETD